MHQQGLTKNLSESYDIAHLQKTMDGREIDLELTVC